MNKILCAAAATLIAASTIAASAAPASAGGSVSFGFGGWGSGPSHGGVYVELGPHYGGGPVYAGNPYKKHVKWCFAHHDNYNPNTNYYKTKWGWKECDSPFL